MDMDNKNNDSIELTEIENENNSAQQKEETKSESDLNNSSNLDLVNNDAVLMDTSENNTDLSKSEENENDVTEKEKNMLNDMVDDVLDDIIKGNMGTGLEIVNDLEEMKKQVENAIEQLESQNPSMEVDVSKAITDSEAPEETTLNELDQCINQTLLDLPDMNLQENNTDCSDLLNNEKKSLDQICEEDELTNGVHLQAGFENITKVEAECDEMNEVTQQDYLAGIEDLNETDSTDLSKITTDTDGIIADIHTITTDSNGIITDSDGITDSNALTSDSNGITTNPNGITTDSNEITNDTNGIETNPNGIITDSNGIIIDSSGIALDLNDATTDPNGVMTDLYGTTDFDEAKDPDNIRMSVDETINDLNAEKEASQFASPESQENINISSILETTLIMGKRNLPNSVSNVTTNLISENSNVSCGPTDEMETFPSDTNGDDEFDLFTPEVTVDEIPPNTKQEPIDTELDETKNDAVVSKSSQTISNSIQKSGIATSQPTPDLIVREFCLQQDSLCNLVSASIESTLQLDSVPKGDQDESFVQHLLLAETGITSFLVIEDIFKQIKQLTSTEYLFLYAKIQIKCSDFDASLLKTNVDIKRKSKISYNKTQSAKILQTAKKSLSKPSMEKVEEIMSGINRLSASECLFLHDSLPKVYKAIKDVLQKTTICCRPIVSQTVMWFKTHYQECPTVLISKPDVYRNYTMFCAKNDIKPCGVPDFGKMIKRTFPNIFHRRQVLRGKTQYFYCGLKPHYKLPAPKLPKLSDKTSTINESYSCSRCCVIYAYMHNLKFRMKPVKDYLTALMSEGTTKKGGRPSNKEGGKSKGNVVNGKPVLVHDPLELLSLTMNDNSNSQTSLNDHTYVQLKKNTDKLYTPRTPKKPVVKEYKNTKLAGKSRSRGRIIKVKYKQYQHPSIKNLKERYQNIEICHTLFKYNVDPVVCLENEELHNWCAIKIKNFMEQLSNISIAKASDNPKVKVKHDCCGTSSRIAQSFGETLRDLKKDLENLEIKKNRCDNYVATYHFSPSQLPMLENTQDNKLNPMTKKLSLPKSNSFDNLDKQNRLKLFPSIKYKHPSVNSMLKRIDSLMLPEEILSADIDPVIVLNSREVINWYEDQLTNLKKINLLDDVDENADVDIEGDNDELVTPRESRAKLMNFCESDSFDSADVAIPNDKQIEPVPLQLPIENTTAQVVERSEKRPLPRSTFVGPASKRPFHLSDIINDSENRVSTNPPIGVPEAELRNSELTCFFCLQEFKTPKELSNHKEIHLRCRTCKRRMPSEDAMRVHLIKHCFMNNALCAPNLILSRVDDVSPEPPGTFLPNISIVPSTVPNILSHNKKRVVRRKSVAGNKYPTSILNFNNINHNIDQLVLPMVPSNLLHDNNNRKARSSQLSAKSQKSANYLRFAKPTSPEVSHYQITTNNFKDIPDGQTLQQSTSQLKNTISNNFNRIFLLSNNTSHSPVESPNVVYGLYLNNRTDRSTPICLNNYNRIGSDCALNTNPSCGISESTNFMQIVETPNTSLPPYDPTMIAENTIAPYEQHQDHSYYQQPVFPINNDVSSLNSGLLNGVPQENIHSNSLFEMPYLNNINTENPPCSEPLVSNTSKIENTNPLPPPMPGPFRIRVKDIRELS